MLSRRLTCLAASVLAWTMVCIFGVTAQPVPSVPDTIPVDSLPLDTLQADTLPGPAAIRADTILFIPPDMTNALPVSDTTNLEERLRQQPTLALFKSLLVPGWGQVGNRRYVKALLFAGLQAWFAGATVHYGRQAGDFKDHFALTPPSNVSVRNQYYALFEDRRTERNKYIWFFGLTTLVSIFDAFVDAHLSGNPAHQEEPVALTVRASGDGPRAMLMLRF